MNKIFSILLAGGLMAAATGCTISEPSLSDGNAGGHLESITSLGMPLFYLSYDAAGNVTEVAAPEADMIINVEYSNGKPTRFVVREYEEVSHYNPETEKETYEYVLSDRTEWTDIAVNSDGYITSVNTLEESYDIWGSGQLNTTERYTTHMDYDAEGHMTRYYFDDGDSTDLVWSDGLMMSVDDGDYTMTYTYDNAPVNARGQWVPMWGDVAIFQMTGLLGAAPAKMPTSIYSSAGSFRMNLRYELNSYGQVSLLRYATDEDSDSSDLILSLKFNYK